MGSRTDASYPQGRPAPADTEIHPLLAARWSPRALHERPVEPEKLRAVFEAARWAPSSFNEQPWRFLVATAERPRWLERLRGYLVPANRVWAGRAPVLVASAYRSHFAHDGSVNRMALRDLGAAEENLALQAFAEGLVVHPMAGFDADRLKEELLPDGFEPGAMTAIGYPGDPEALPEKLRAAEARARRRRPLSSLVLGEDWEAAPGV